MSEPDGNGGYQDNPNVLFEAGMFHGRTDGIIAATKSWIPIREEQSPEIPFDFAQQRMVVVKRTREGDLKVRDFKRDMSDKLRGLLDAATGT